MIHEQFDAFQAHLFEQSKSICATKGKEYANSTQDRFANFRRLAAQLDLEDYQVGWVYLSKHLDAIANYCKMGGVLSGESIQGRLLDAVTYLSLIAGMIHEHEFPTPNEAQKPTEPTLKLGNADLYFLRTAASAWLALNPDHNRAESTRGALARSVPAFTTTDLDY